MGEARTAVLGVLLSGPTLLEREGPRSLALGSCGECAPKLNHFFMLKPLGTQDCVLSKHLGKPKYKLVAFLLLHRRYNKLLKANFLTIKKID